MPVFTGGEGNLVDQGTERRHKSAIQGPEPNDLGGRGRRSEHL